MGGFCSCHRQKKFGFYFVEEEEDNNAFLDCNEDFNRASPTRLETSSQLVSMYTQQGKKLSVNQDAMIVWENFGGVKDMFFCAVFDGHGPCGHKVAQYVRDHLPSILSSSSTRSSINGFEDKGGNQGQFFSAWKPRILESFQDMDDQLEGDAQIESYTSGASSVAAFRKGEHLIVANLGDSRAVLCSRDDNDELVAEQLTVDLKPNVPGEMERITSCQGRIKPMDEEPSIYRIWMPHQDCPGLAMARAFGDFCLKDFGVISIPELFSRKLTDKDEFIVLATDGVWDVLSNNEVVNIVGSAVERSTSAKLLVEEAVATWKHKFPLAKADDCAVVCLFFKSESPKPKSSSGVAHLSWTGGNSRTRTITADDGLDTVLNCNIRGSPQAETKGDDSDHRLGKRRRLAKRFRSYGS